MDDSPAGPCPGDLRPFLRPFPRPLPGPRSRVCLVTAVRPGRGLSETLVRCLSAEMPSLRFTLTPRPGVASVWVCGYASGPASAECVAKVRACHPRALVLATGRGPLPRWGPEARAAGADVVLGWPAPYGRVELLLGGRPARVGPRPVLELPASGPRSRTA